MIKLSKGTLNTLIYIHQKVNVLIQIIRAEEKKTKCQSTDGHRQSLYNRVEKKKEKIDELASV